MPEFPLNPELAAVSHQLGGLTPRPAALDRDRLLYEAGRRSVRSRPWPVIAGLFAVVSVSLAVRLATVPPRTEIVYVTKSQGDSVAIRERQQPEGGDSRVTPVGDAPGSTAGYFGLRNLVVRFGADNLPSLPPAASAPPPPVEFMLGLPPGALDDAQKSRWQHQLF